VFLHHDVKVETTNLHFTSCMIFGAMHAMQPANIMHELFGSHSAMPIIKKCMSAKSHHSTDMTLMELVSATGTLTFV
jgi:hypothetical protein